MDRLDCYECQELEHKIINAAEDVADNVVLGGPSDGYVAKLVEAVDALHSHLKGRRR